MMDGFRVVAVQAILWLGAWDLPAGAAEVVRVQAGFFTPRRAGAMWDTWAYYHEGRYYLYYLAGERGRWDGHGVAISPDGVHWTDRGVVLRPRPGVKWMGTGHIWKAPDFATSRRWVMNYSEWVGRKQDIHFATSRDLLAWTKVDEKYRFVQDTRWYKALGRWDCIDVLPRGDGGLYGYFTADPDRAKVPYPCCGFGMAESRDGIRWTALPPPKGDVAGEFGGIQAIDGRCYILLSEGRVGVGPAPAGPFHAQAKNPNAFGRGCDIYFPRFFHNAPGGPLVNHFFTRGPVYAAPFKAVEVDREGILRLKWWRGNDALKAARVGAAPVPAGEGRGGPIRWLDAKLAADRVHVVEGALGPAGAGARRGIVLDRGDGNAWFLAVERDGASFGSMRADGSGARVLLAIRRGIDFGPRPRLRLLVHLDMVELYVNDYLMLLKRAKCSGRIGWIGGGEALRDAAVWRGRRPRAWTRGG